MVTHVDGCASNLNTLIDDRKRNVVRLERDVGRALQCGGKKSIGPLIATIATTSDDRNIGDLCYFAKPIYT